MGCYVVDRITDLFVASVVICFLVAATEGADYVPPCYSTIYCQGKLLDTIQMAKIHKDSKTFVDMKMVHSQSKTLQNFKDMMEKHKNSPSKSVIRTFVRDHFDEAGSEFEMFDPVDWEESPAVLYKIKDLNLRDWARKLNKLWSVLGRKISPDVRSNPQQYSIIYVPNLFVIPGGRFREFYYWDSYWIIRGLLISEMYTTAKGMLENFLYMVEKYGFVPNGGRIYYLNRSQPPLLIPMVKEYFDTTFDKNFIAENIQTLEKEFNFWIKNRAITLKKNEKSYTFVRYSVSAGGPRPESYREDVEVASYFSTDEKKQTFYKNIKAAAETGWDFSTRWFIKDGQNKGNLTNLRTSSIVPVDLNSFIYGNAVILSKFYKMLGDKAKSTKYAQTASKMLDGVTAFMWNEDAGIWFDYDMDTYKYRNYYYASNITPLWTNCYNRKQTTKIVKKVLGYLNKHKIFNFPGGFPTSLETSGEQWDLPNSWPPLVHLAVVGLFKTGDPDAQKVAFELSQKWIKANFKGFSESGEMYEKYDTEKSGGYGGGGEYTVQSGFGWTNGVCMDFLDRFGDSLVASSRCISVNKRILIITFIINRFLINYTLHNTFLCKIIH